MYVFGRGPSELALTASPGVTTKGSSVLIKGTILDMSAGQSGTPCISDEDMTAWMEYLYLQMPKPENAQGVPVKLAYQLPDGSWKDIDQVISDDDGNFGFSWTPPDQGTYRVKAFFLGSESYGSSYATTYIAVGPAVENVEPAATDLSGLEDSIANQMTYIVAILVIVIIALLVAIYSLLKSRK